MKFLIIAITISLAITAPFATAADDKQDPVDPAVDSYVLEMKEPAPFKDVVLEQHRLLKKILEIQEKTLLILDKRKKFDAASDANQEADKLLKQVHKAKKDAYKLDKEIEKVSNRPRKLKNGLTIEYSYTDADDLAP